MNDELCTGTRLYVSRQGGVVTLHQRENRKSPKKAHSRFVRNSENILRCIRKCQKMVVDWNVFSEPSTYLPGANYVTVGGGGER